MNSVLSDKRYIFWLVFPGFSIFAFAVLLPVAVSFFFGLTDWTGMGAMRIIGFKNYVELLTKDGVFYRSLLHAVILALATVCLQHPVALLFAYLISRSAGKFEKFFRAVFFVPCVISVVVTSKMWVSVYEPTYGLLNKILAVFGVSAQQWLGDPKLVLLSVIFIVMWQGFGWAMLIYYAGIKGLSSEIFEAAAVDGANKWTLLTKISLPMLLPVVSVNVTLAVVSSLKQMETVYLTTNGGPGNMSQFLANYLYIQAFSSYRYGYGNAISVVFVAFCLLITLVMNRMFKKGLQNF
ncbi:carbohydrate ABC transporter permease [Treponema brennaborense]|uniref:ABC-type transporter, integral membrane subunit n=1 Tax=Treponema brennaborense (strain DSM 12168 / CIP 105900 / DD5/3) TaxID=906968 RepID=F4LMY5_TREBD|nr:sugar ABC transporter permease [Treponema brennaborense]AEE15771.1 ABC-type transporter, integral membrane subunit [Treponema brennaborense DSM 12168]